MCATCGCSADSTVIRLTADGPEQRAADGHEHLAADGSRTVVLQRKVLEKNDAIAVRNATWLADRGVVMLNLMSSPGAGKTTLLERTGRDLAGGQVIAVIEGDQETALDARRVSAVGCRVVQINTGAGCHLDAAMVARGLTALDPPAGSLVLVENVGNLVCPALFDLGESARVVLASVTEGQDKPLKYPHMFRRADLVLVTKVDLLPYLDIDLDRFAADVASVSPAARSVELSTVTGAGLTDWYDWIADRAAAAGRA